MQLLKYISELIRCRIPYFILGAVSSFYILALILTPKIDIDFLLRLIQSFGVLATGFGVFIAFFTYKSNLSRYHEEHRKKISKEFLDESNRVLSWAYETFSRSSDNTPKNDRVLWLTTARMIERYKKIKSQITEQEHSLIANEHEEYWRHRFYELLHNNKDKLTKDYFMPLGDPYHHEAIDIKSLAVILLFTKWRKGVSDPLDEIDHNKLFEEYERLRLNDDFPGVVEFLDAQKKCCANMNKSSE